MNTTLNYSPQLKEIMSEIKAVLQKHDVAAYILLHEPGFSEYLISIEPSWSIIRLEKNSVRFRSKLNEDFGGDQDAQLDANTRTANLVCHFSDVLANGAALFGRLEKVLNKTWQIEHSACIHTPDRKN